MFLAAEMSLGVAEKTSHDQHHDCLVRPDSSVVRASGICLEDPWFNPQSGHLFCLTNESLELFLARWGRDLDRYQTNNLLPQLLLL